MSDICRIALTSGEPAGIGPDLCIQLAQQAQRHQIVVIADPELLQQRADELGLPIKLIEFEPDLAPNRVMLVVSSIWQVSFQKKCWLVN